MFNINLNNILYVKGFLMSKIFTYVRNNQNNLKYTQEQKESIDKYIKKHNITVFKDIFYDISYTDYLFSLPMGAGKTTVGRN